jgi:hypothetical protein
MSDNHRPDGWHIDRRTAGVWLEDWKGGRPVIRLHLTADQFDRLSAAMLADTETRYHTVGAILVD